MGQSSPIFVGTRYCYFEVVGVEVVGIRVVGIRVVGIEVVGVEVSAGQSRWWKSRNVIRW